MGARVRVTAEGMTQTKEVYAGMSFVSQDSMWLTFGLGSSQLADAIEIRWPSGLVEKFVDVAAGQTITMVEGENFVSTQPVLADPPNDRLKNRYISFKPNNAGESVKLRVALTASLPHLGSIGDSWWVQAPIVTVPGQSPKPLVGPGECVALLGAAATAAELDWEAAGCETLHVSGCPIEPTSEYEVRAVIANAASSAVFVPTTLKPGPKWWGDAVGIFDGTQWTPAQGATNIDDAVAAVKTFQGGQVLPPGPIPPGNVGHLSWLDVVPGNINTVVNFDDVFMIVQAFQGSMYPFGPADADGSCP